MATESKTSSKNNPKNIAIIMDGNGRWAKSNSFNISKGHQRGVSVVKEIVEESVAQNISSLTLYAFSSENWSRPKPEVEAIKKLVVDAINEQVSDLKKQKVKLKFFGRIEDFGKRIVKKVHNAERETNCIDPSLRLNIALGYGGRQDAVDSTKEISSKVLSGDLKIENIDEDLLNQFSCVPVDEIDLLIRSGGDRRISNFLLYQIAYSEIIFVDKFWPDFTKDDYIECINNFMKVSRRFGKRI